MDDAQLDNLRDVLEKAERIQNKINEIKDSQNKLKNSYPSWVKLENRTYIPVPSDLKKNTCSTLYSRIRRLKKRMGKTICLNMMKMRTTNEIIEAVRMGEQCTERELYLAIISLDH